jgi:hypothetical protein
MYRSHSLAANWSSSAPKAAAMPSTVCAARLSISTMSPGRNAGTRIGCTRTRQAAPLIAPSRTKRPQSVGTQGAHEGGGMRRKGRVRDNESLSASVAGSGSCCCGPRSHPERPGGAPRDGIAQPPGQHAPALRPGAPVRWQAAPFSEDQAKASQGLAHGRHPDLDAMPGLHPLA